MTNSPSKARKNEEAIAALLSESTIAKAAEKAGISERTLSRRLADPEFQDAYSQAKARLLDGTVNRLRSIGLDGAEALKRIAIDTNAPPAAQVSAGRAILEVLFRAIETQDLVERLDRLEAAQKGEK
jgi:hypothetical protein